jgi:hypothetical protein
MRRRLWSFTQLAVALTLVGCNFKQPSASQTGTGGVAGGTGAGGAAQKGSGGSPSTGAGGSPGTGGISSSTGGMTGMTGDITGSGGTTCGQTNVSIKPLPPDILIVQDRSGSMQDPTDPKCTGTTCSKWSQVATAIGSVVQATDTKVNWGLDFFPSDNACAVTQTPIVSVGPMTAQPIQNAFTSIGQPNGKTPTAAAVNAAVAYLRTLTDPNPKFLLLATDGLPNCGANAGVGGTGGGMLPGGMMPDDSPAAEAAVSAAKMAGFPTFVVGISTSSDAMANATLNTLAVNGGYPQTGAATQYYSVSDTASLQAALNKIIGMTLSCTIPLGDKPDNLSNVAVSAQDAQGKRIEVPQDPTNGWSFDSTMTTIVLNGSACSDLQSVSLTEYQFIFACADVKICIDSCPGH